MKYKIEVDTTTIATDDAKLMARLVDVVMNNAEVEEEGKKPSECKICGKILKNKAGVSMHKSKAHGIRGVTSVYRIFATDNEGMYKCTACDFENEVVYRVDDHFNKEHKNTNKWTSRNTTQ